MSILRIYVRIIKDLKDKSGVVIGSWLARYLNLSMGDEVMYSLIQLEQIFLELIPEQ